MRSQPVPVRAAALLVAGGLLLPTHGCAPDRGGEAPEDRVVATILPVSDLVSRLVGGDVPVSTLLPPGVNPKAFEPTPSTLREARGARLVVTVGGGLDEWVRELVEASGTTAEIHVLTRGMDLLSEGEEPGSGNPHVWLDPVLVRDAVLPALREVLVRSFPEREAAITGAARALRDSLTSLDASIRRRLEGAPTRSFLPTHAAWAYFARRYDLRAIGPVHPAPGREPSARFLGELVDSARAAGVRAVIAEPQLSGSAPGALAAELGVPVVEADPLGSPSHPERSRYLSLMRYNARSFAVALGKEGAR